MTSVQSGDVRSFARRTIALTEVLVMSMTNKTREPKEAALERINNLFGLSLDSAAEDLSSLKDFPPQPVSDWKENAYDILLEDILFIRRTLGDNLRRCDSVNTVGDWCALVERYAQKRPKAFAGLARSWEKEQCMKTARPWRRMLYKLLGV